MIYELRISTVKQRSPSEVVKAAGIVWLEIRKDGYSEPSSRWSAPTAEGDEDVARAGRAR
jgi:hypothetical protein